MRRRVLSLLSATGIAIAGPALANPQRPDEVTGGTVAIVVRSPQPDAGPVAPSIDFSPAGGTYAPDQQVEILVEFCEPTSGGTFDSQGQILFNGQWVANGAQGSKAGCADYQSALVTVTMQAGTNTLSAAVCSQYGCGENWANYDGGDIVAPSVFSSVPTSYVITEYPQITVDWCDNISLNAGTRSILVNGVNRTSSFTYTSGSAYLDCTIEAQSTTTTVPLVIGSNALSAAICDSAGNCTTYPFTIIRRAGPLPAVSLAPYSPDLQDFSRCAAACFAATHAQSTVPRYSLDTPRSVTLVYNSARIEPRPFIHVDLTTGSPAPSEYRLRLRKADGSYIRFVNGSPDTLTTLRFAAGSGTLRLGGLFSADSNGMSATGVYPITVVIGAVYPLGVEETALNTRVIVVNETNSPIARGWTVGGIQRLFVQADGSALITEGDGSALYFLKLGGTFVTPTGDFSRLTVTGSGGTTTYTRAYPDSTKVTFAYDGLMTQVRDRFSNTTTITHSAGRVIRIADPLGLADTLVYDANGNLDWIRDAHGRTTQITVNATNRRLTTFRDPDNVNTTFGYTSAHRLNTITDRRGVLVEQFYYLTVSGEYSGLVDSVAGPTIELYGGGSGRPTTRLQPWQRLGVPFGLSSNPVTAPLADTVRATITDAGGHATRFTVNAFGQPTLAFAGPSDTVRTTYNAAGQAVLAVAKHGSVIDSASITYNASGLPTSSIRNGDTTHTRYAAWAIPDSVWGNAATPTRMLVSNGRVDYVRVASLYHTWFYYESRGRVERVVDPLGHLVSRTWFEGTNGNRSRDSLPGGNTVVNGYDTYGRRTTSRRTGHPAQVITYDIINRQTSFTDSVNAQPMVFAWDSMQLRSVTDPAGNVYSFGHNPLGWAIRETDPLGRSDSVQYDIEGLVRRTINRRGQPDTVTYDAAHRPLVTSGLAVAPDTLSYAADGRSLTTSNAVTSETAYLGATGLLDSVRTVLHLPSGSNRTFRQRFWYNAITRRLDSTATTDTSGSVAFLSRGYRYNSRGLLDSMRLGTEWTRFERDDDGTPVMVRFPDYDSIARGVLEGHQSPIVHSSIMADTIHFDSLGRLDRLNANDGQRQRVFRYDGLGRLSEVDFQTRIDGCTWIVYAGYVCDALGDSAWTVHYDAAGNPWWIERDSAGGFNPDTYITYGAGNRIQSYQGPGWTSFPSCTYTTDFDGNVTARNCTHQSLSLGWDGGGRLDSLRVDNAPAIRYRYDAAGRLVRRDSAGAVVSWFLWDGGNLLAELGPGGSTKIAEYSYYGIDDPHAIVVGTTPYYAHRDQIGNVRGYSRDFTQYASYVYGPWGQRLGGGDGGFERPQWKGALMMERTADLFYMRNRWYEPLSGRFMTEDPIGIMGGLNLYAFGANDPVGNADPTGTHPCPSGWEHSPEPEHQCYMPSITIRGFMSPHERASYDMYAREDQCSLYRDFNPWDCIDHENHLGLTPRVPPRLRAAAPSCGQRLASGSAAVLVTLALPGLLNASAALPGAAALSTRSYAYARIAGAAAIGGNQVNARFYGWLAGATATAYRQDLGNFVVAGAGAAVSLLVPLPPPAGLPDWYGTMRRAPGLGAGMLLGEGIACYGGMYN